MASRYTERSIRIAMMEQVCQGLEGHHPKDFKAYQSPHMFYLAFQCSKCKLFVHIKDAELELEYGDSETDFPYGFNLPGPRETPPYP